jgi:hypothetical protein
LECILPDCRASAHRGAPKRLSVSLDDVGQPPAKPVSLLYELTNPIEKLFGLGVHEAE